MSVLPLDEFLGSWHGIYVCYVRLPITLSQPFAHEGNKDPFFGLREPFSGLNEMDFEIHGIYMDHEPDEEFVTPLDKRKDTFLNVNSSLTNDVRAQVYHGGDLQSDEDEEDQEQVINKYIIHDPKTRWDKMEPKLGDIFENSTMGINYFEKCDSTRIFVRCGKRNEDNGCPFRLYASWMFNERSIQIKTLEATHVCGWKFKLGSMVTLEWIGRHYITKIAKKPKVKLKEMITDIRQRFRCVVSISQCHRAKKGAKELIEGKLTEHYAMIWHYAQDLLRSNLCSTSKVCVTVNPDGINYFHGFYIGCRRVIGLDGCFLKGAVKGELLKAIGRDANNHVYPIAWAVVDTWFLELLRDDLDLDSGRGLVVISDQHKGLLESVKDILPHVEHRNCVRHIYAKFRKAFIGLEYKKLFLLGFEHSNTPKCTCNPKYLGSMFSLLYMQL
uniref:MULE transposase domain-containing protein n=1 Tax=Lactuca sativa TaxID=4236 RepID=A0A9R1V1X0_LACSA|nr:hypothetical protein LSAT_V11C700376280 [Lactuca sativa]